MAPATAANVPAGQGRQPTCKNVVGDRQILLRRIRPRSDLGRIRGNRRRRRRLQTAGKTHVVVDADILSVLNLVHSMN